MLQIETIYKRGCEGIGEFGDAMFMSEELHCFPRVEFVDIPFQGGSIVYCQECGAKNDDSAAFCNKCGAAIAKAEEPEVVVVHANGLSRDRIEIGTKDDGQPDVKVVKGDVPKKGIAIAIVAILLVAGAGLAYFYGNFGGNDGPTFEATDGVFVLTDSGSIDRDQTVLYKGTITITVKDGHMTYSTDINKQDAPRDTSPAAIKRYTVDLESNNTPLWPDYSPMKDMKECFSFLSGYQTTSIMCTFSDGTTTVDAYKFVCPGMSRAIYVSTDGVIYQWCEKVDSIGMSFILNGWTRTSNGGGYFS